MVQFKQTALMAIALFLLLVGCATEGRIRQVTDDTFVDVNCGGRSCQHMLDSVSRNQAVRQGGNMTFQDEDESSSASGSPYGGYGYGLGGIGYDPSSTAMPENFATMRVPLFAEQATQAYNNTITETTVLKKKRYVSREEAEAKPEAKMPTDAEAVKAPPAEAKPADEKPAESSAPPKKKGKKGKK